MHSRTMRGTIAWALIALMGIAGQAYAAEPLTFAQGFSRIAAQTDAGRRLEAEFSLTPGALPLGKESSSGMLRALLGGMHVTMAQQTGERALTDLSVAVLEEPVWWLTRVAEGDQAVWRSAFWPDDVIAPRQVNVWAELFQDDVMGTGAAALFALGKAAQTPDRLGQSLIELVRSVPAGTKLPAAQINQVLDMLVAEGLPEGALRETCAAWRAAGELALKVTWAENGDWQRVRGELPIARGKEEPWAVTFDVRQSHTNRQYNFRVDLSLRQDRNNRLVIEWSRQVQAPSSDLNKQDSVLAINGILGGSTLRGQVRETSENAYAMEGDTLVERVKQEWKASGNTDDTRWQKGDMHRWVVNVRQNGTLRTGEAADAENAFEGQADIAMYRAGKLFWQGQVPWRLHTSAAVPPPTAGQTADWQGVTDARRAELRQHSVDGVLATLASLWQRLAAAAQATE